MATGLNNLGQVVGYSEIDSGGPTHAFLWDPARGMQDLGSLGGEFSQAWGVNDSSQVVGLALTAEPREVAFLWDPRHGMTILESQGWAEAYAVNNHGETTGRDGMRPVRWLPGGPPRDLGFVLTDGHPTSINDLGQIAGISDLPGYGGWMEAVIWNPDSTLIQLGAFSEAGSEARGINSSGEVVGFSAHTIWDATVATYWDPQHQITDLNHFAPFRWDLISAQGINARGDIVGLGYDGIANQAVVLWTDGISGVEDPPVPAGSLTETSGEATRAAARSLRVIPNPGSGPVQVWLAPGEGGDYRIQVFDPLGRLVDDFTRTLSGGSGRPSPVVWDPRRRGEDRPSAGVYVLRITDPSGAVQHGRCVLLPR